MSQALYTQSALVKNPYEVLKNLEIEARDGIISNYIIPEPSPGGGYQLPRLIVPGFINMHAHLAYTYSKAATEQLNQNKIDTSKQLASMFEWLSELTEQQFRAEKTCLLPQHISNARAAIASGTTFVVDNSNSPALSIEAYKQTGLRGIIGIEVFGSDPDLAEEIFTRKVEEINKLAARCNDSIELCFSPHATYDVSVKLWRQLLDWTRVIASEADVIARSEEAKRHCETRNKLSLRGAVGDEAIPRGSMGVLRFAQDDAMRQLLRFARNDGSATTHIAPLLLSHAAESEAEEAWFRDKDSEQASPARKFWQQINTLEPKLKHWRSYKSSIDMLAKNNLLDPCLLLTHLCCASDEDLVTLADAGVNLVTCPRSNAYLHNPRARVEKWSSNFGIGTDSLASNYDWDLRREVNELKHLSALEKLELLTTKPAKILGKNLGALELGYAADYTVFEIRNKDIDLSNPIELLFDTELCVPVATYIAGSLCHREPT